MDVLQNSKSVMCAVVTQRMGMHTHIDVPKMIQHTYKVLQAQRSFYHIIMISILVISEINWKIVDFPSECYHLMNTVCT